MIIGFQFFAVITFFLSSNLTSASVSTCNKSLKPTGFTRVKSEKSYFHSEPNEKKRNKSYIVTSDFVQILGQHQDGFSCVMFRNYNGHGGKPSLGWLLTDSLEPIKTKLERKDLFASWNKSPCSDDSCVIDIAEVDGKVEINLMSYLHERPGQSYQVGQIQEKDGRWVLSQLQGSAEAPKKMEIEFDKTSEPGTISVAGPNGWAGIYHR